MKSAPGYDGVSVLMVDILEQLVNHREYLIFKLMVSTIKTTQNLLHLPFPAIDFVAAQNNNLCNMDLSCLSKLKISPKKVFCKISFQRVGVHSNGQESGMQFE